MAVKSLAGVGASLFRFWTWEGYTGRFDGLGLVLMARVSVLLTPLRLGLVSIGATAGVSVVATPLATRARRASITETG